MFLPRACFWILLDAVENAIAGQGHRAHGARRMNFQTTAFDVVEFVAVRASKNIIELQNPSTDPQHVQSKAVIFNRFQQNSISV
jgi:hypothetical protein